MINRQGQRISGQRIAGLVRKKLPGVRVWMRRFNFDTLLGVGFKHKRHYHGLVIKGFVRPERELQKAANQVVEVLKKARRVYG